MNYLSIKEKDGKISVQRRVTLGNRVSMSLLPALVAMVFTSVMQLIFGFGVNFDIIPYSFWILPTLIFFVVFFRPLSGGPILLDPQNKTITRKGVTIQVGPDSGVYLTRRLTSRWSRRKNTTSYISTWTISVDDRPIFVTRVIIRSSPYSTDKLFNQPWVDALAEYVAEQMGIKLVDQTGMGAHVRTSGETDLPLGVYLRQNEPELEDYSIENHFSKIYRIRRNGDDLIIAQNRMYFNLYWTAISLFLILVIYLVLLSSNWFELAVVGIIFFFTFNGSRRRLVIKIHDSTMRVMTKGTFIKISSTMIPMQEIERMTISKMFAKELAVELVSDRRRYIIMGSLDEEEAQELEFLLKIAFAQTYTE